MHVLKQRYAQRILRELRRRRVEEQAWLWESQPVHVWQARFYDFNVRSEHKRVEKLLYMHRNPVMRGLVNEPEDWVWSTFRYYWRGKAGKVRLNETDVLKMRV